MDFLQLQPFTRRLRRRRLALGLGVVAASVAATTGTAGATGVASTGDDATSFSKLVAPPLFVVVATTTGDASVVWESFWSPELIRSMIILITLIWWQELYALRLK